MRSIPFLLIFILATEALNILVYSPILGQTHTRYLAAIAEILTEANHDVTVLMPVIKQNERDKHGLKKTKKRIFVDPDEKVMKRLAVTSGVRKIWTSNRVNPRELFESAANTSKTLAETCTNLMKQTKILARLREEKFDLGIAEPFSACGFALFHAIGLKNYVSAISGIRFDHVSQAIGEPIIPSFIPGTMSLFWDWSSLTHRLLNTIQTHLGIYIVSGVNDKEIQAIRKIIPNMPDWRELVARSIFIFPNTIPFLDFPAPTLNKVVPIGGISVSSMRGTNKLPEEWDKVLSQTEKTVLISFGSNAESLRMPNLFKISMVHLFESMPNVTFIWKHEYDQDPFFKHLTNVYLASSLPELELLADKRLSLFITDGELGSTMELATLGKASIVIPLFSDQYRNVNMLTRHGGALSFVKENLGRFSLLKDAVLKVLNDKSFANNATKLADMLKNQPTNARETLLNHVEFAAKFGQQTNTDPYSRKLSFCQYYILDGLFIVVSIILVVPYVLYKIARLIFNSLCRFTQKLKTE